MKINLSEENQCSLSTTLNFSLLKVVLASCFTPKLLLSALKGSAKVATTPCRFTNPCLTMRCCYFPTLKCTEQATKRRRGQWPPGDDSPDVAWFSIGVPYPKRSAKIVVEAAEPTGRNPTRSDRGFFSLPLNVKTRDGQEIDHLKS